MQTPRFLLPGAIILLLVTGIALGVTIIIQAQRAETRLETLRQLTLDRQNAPVAAPAQPEPTPPQPTVADRHSAVDVTLDADGTVRAQEFTASLPAGWHADAPEPGLLNVFDTAGTNVANVRCPVPETGYEAWDFTQTDRAYVRDGVMRYATKWVGAPNEHADGLEWLAIIMGGSPEPGIWGTYGCQIMMHVSAPPTKAELDTVDAIFESIR